MRVGGVAVGSAVQQELGHSEILRPDAHVQETLGIFFLVIDVVSRVNDDLKPRSPEDAT